MNLILRRNGTGLETVRNINSKMQSPMTIRNDATALPRGDGGYLFSWGYIRNVPNGFIVLNTPEAVGRTSNKALFRKKLWENGLTMPTYTNVDEAIRQVRANPIYLWLLRPPSHFGGSDIIHIDSGKTDEYIRSRFGQGYYMSKYINKDREFRVFITQGRVAYVVEKIVEDSSVVAWNVHQGGRFENVRFADWNLKVVEYALKAFALTSLDYGAVDVMVKDNDVYVLEINTAPQLTAEYWTECVSKTFDYIITNGKERLVVPNHTNWKYMVHPAVSDKALLQVERSFVRSTRFEVEGLMILKKTYKEWSDGEVELESSVKVVKVYDKFRDVIFNIRGMFANE